MRIKVGRIEEGLAQSVDHAGAAHLTLIDPDSQTRAGFSYGEAAA
jgi:heptaprenylglyceryl phosphate synthase